MTSPWIRACMKYGLIACYLPSVASFFTPAVPLRPAATTSSVGASHTPLPSSTASAWRLFSTITSSPSSLTASSTLTAIADVPFTKYEGLGNDFILIDDRRNTVPSLTPDESAALCDRHFGIGGDGVIFALAPSAATTGGGAGTDYDFAMRIYNSDGSEPEMCGNGIRCMARFLADLEGKKSTTYNIDTLAGPIIPVVREDGQVTVDMGYPILNGPDVPTTLPADASGKVIKAPLHVAGKDWEVTCVSMGNPHAIMFVDDLDEIDLPKIGASFETNAVFPAKTNVEFVQVISRKHLKMKVWERGAGITLACGTGACALAVAGVLNGLVERTCTVTLPGGDLIIEWRESDNKVYMTGPATRVFAGSANVKKA